MYGFYTIVLNLVFSFRRSDFILSTIPSTKALHNAFIIGLNKETGKITVIGDDRVRVLRSEPQIPTRLFWEYPSGCHTGKEMLTVSKPSFLRALIVMLFFQTYRLLLSGVTCDQFGHVAYSRLPCHHACGWSWRVFMVSKILLTTLYFLLQLNSFITYLAWASF